MPSVKELRISTTQAMDTYEVNPNLAHEVEDRVLINAPVDLQDLKNRAYDLMKRYEDAKKVVLEEENQNLLSKQNQLLAKQSKIQIIPTRPPKKTEAKKITVTTTGSPSTSGTSTVTREEMTFTKITPEQSVDHSLYPQKISWGAQDVRLKDMEEERKKMLKEQPKVAVMQPETSKPTYDPKTEHPPQIDIEDDESISSYKRHDLSIQKKSTTRLHARANGATLLCSGS